MSLMRTLRVLLICLGFAAADLVLPVAPSALEVLEEADEEHHRVRRGALRRALTLTGLATTREIAVVVIGAVAARPRIAPTALAFRNPVRKIPVAPEPTSSPEDQP
jgi:hypothetical protein